jgi:cell division protein FtsZ
MAQGRTNGYANIKVVGCGGGGSNAVNRMIETGLAGVEFIAVNTDIQVLELSAAPVRLQIGDALTKGLGAGGNPEVGRNAAEESRQDIKKLLEGSDMIFIAAGMGGGTGTGAAPVIAEIARDLGALTVGIVTKPFRFEGPRRLRLAEEGIANLRGRVDTTIVIPNDKLLDVVEKRAALVDAFRQADDTLRQGVQGVSDIITVPGLINVDFNDVKAVMSNAGTAIMGIGTGMGDNRAVTAADMAISSPLLETSIEGARGVLLNVTAGPDLTLEELYDAAGVVSKATDAEDAFIIMGTVIDESMGQTVRVTVLATGFGNHPTTTGRLFEAAEEVRHATRSTHATVAAPLPTAPPAPPVTRVVAPTPAPAVAAQPSANGSDLDIPPFLRNAGRR